MNHQATPTIDAAADVPITALKGVGPRQAERLQRLGIHTVQDMLFHLPLRYQDRTRVVPLAQLVPGEEVATEGEVLRHEIKIGRRRMLLVHLGDGRGRLTLRFFNFNNAQRQRLNPGVRLRCFGEVRAGIHSLEMTHPEISLTDGEQTSVASNHLTPFYPATEGLHQLSLRDLAAKALTYGGGPAVTLREWLPDDMLQTLNLPSLAEAVMTLHRPPPGIDMPSFQQGSHPAQRRLAFEELLAHHLSLRQLRAKAKQHSAIRIEGDHSLRENLLQSLAFSLTGAQQRVLNEIYIDLARPYPMQRLVQGDVGSGKTVVAALAALAAIESGYQVALMAPTELLAEQHYQNLNNWLQPMGITVAWLAGKVKGKARSEMLSAIESGTAAVAVGTHALFQDEVVFSRLALVIIDEQHRFGVHQRLALRQKGAREGVHPHQLIMTATPIPRTLAMTAYADLDCSVIDELPPGRTPVETVVVNESRREEVMGRVRLAIAEGRQAYWVCTLIEESEALECQTAQDTAAVLAMMMPELRIGLVHGRLKAQEKAACMAAFKAHDIDLLVATTVIEVGVDVPNASLMIVENAERLGLAQLHQLRGRVGRGSARSSCVLMYHPPLSQLARSRLGTLRETSDGFEIARRDLELRGPGEVLGTRQTGEIALRVADLMRDQELIPLVERYAEQLLEQYPERVAPLIRRWLREAARYGAV